MKKILLSTALVAASAGMAAAEVKVSGAARFGLVYTDNNAANVNDVVISARLRFNLDAKFEADNGVTYGGRIRVQSNIGGNSTVDIGGVSRSSSTLSPAQISVEYAGLRFELGNANTAYDSAALLYAPELGYLGRSFGDPQGAYYSFSSGPYGAGEENRVGLYLAYSINGFNVKASYVQADQVLDNAAGESDEYGFSADYTFGSFIVSGAVVFNGAGISNNDNYFIGAAYNFNDVGTFGVNYIDNDFSYLIVGYGNYTVNGITLGAYVSNENFDGPGGSDTGYGIGASYDLGGASLSASYQDRDNGNATADVGINFSF